MVAKKKTAKKKTISIPKTFDMFDKAYGTVTGIAEKVMDMGKEKIEEIISNAQKKIMYAVLIAFPILFLLLGIAEFISKLFPWYGNTSGYMIVSGVLFVIAQFYKKGMS